MWESINRKGKHLKYYPEKFLMGFINRLYCFLTFPNQWYGLFKLRDYQQ
jgi:hypothetical protein